MERLAVPLFGEDVAPRFCAAREVLLSDWTPGSLGQADSISTPWRAGLAGEGWQDRLQSVRILGATVLLCGGFNRRYRPLAEQLGLRVESGLIGRAADLFRAFAEHDLDLHRLGGSEAHELDRCPEDPTASPSHTSTSRPTSGLD